MAGFATRSRFAGHPGRSNQARHALRLIPDHPIGAGHEPIYSHLAYDVLSDRVEVIRQPEILIFEGLNVLQVPIGATITASDFFDFSIYLDAAEADIERWFVERLLVLQRTVFQDPESYFHQFSGLSPDKAAQFAHDVWREINGPNLRENIAPTRARARLILTNLTKGPDHAVREIALRRT